MSGKRERDVRNTSDAARPTLTGRKKAREQSQELAGEISLRLTEGFGQQVLDELGMITDVQHAVDTGVHQLLLVVAQVLGHVLRHEHDVALHVHHEEEAVQGLRGKRVQRVCLSLFFTRIQDNSLTEKWKQKEDSKNMFEHIYLPLLIQIILQQSRLLKAYLPFCAFPYL